ncbi:MAG: MarR family transcriptional regulator [Gracilibacteraceae bacterium]|nr:MarR family transcriptional regulator [Gracilibacteraceae bacterium]
MYDKEITQISIAASIIYRKTQIWKAEQSADLGLSAAQIPAVMIVCRKNGISQNELGEILLLDKSTVAKIVGKLVESGYFIRTINAKDKRAFDLIPTEKAKGAYPHLLELGIVWDKHLTNEMTEEEKATLERLLVKVAENATVFSKKL